MEILSTNSDILQMEEGIPIVTILDDQESLTQSGKKGKLVKAASSDGKVPAVKKLMSQTHQGISRISLFESSPAYSDDFAGEFNFKFSLNAKADNLQFSKRLAKVYVRMGQLLSLCFSWSSWHRADALSSSGLEFYLRASMVFVAPEFRSRPVLRCYAHMAAEAPENRGFAPELLGFVFRATHPRTEYRKSEAGVLSTLTCLGRLDSTTVITDAILDFRFFCKNSCPTGISRRATKMVFTLEDANGRVLGRRSLQIQISSAPKRDKDKDEQDLESSVPGKRKKLAAIPPPLPPSKQREQNCQHDKNVCILKLDVVGEENYKSVLKYAYDLMAAEAYRTGDLELYQPRVEELRQKIFEQ